MLALLPWSLAAAPALAADAPATTAPAPAPLVITPWPVHDPYANVLRFYPGLTFKQGEAPIYPGGVAPAVPDEGISALGLGLEGRAGPNQAWQVLANLTPSAFSPVFDPHLCLHGYLLPRPNWGLDGDLSTDVHGAMTTELATSWLCASGDRERWPFRQARLALGRRALGAGDGYGYGQVSLYRTDAAWPLESDLNLFSTEGGGWRACLDANHTRDLAERLRLRADASIGTSGGALPAGDRLGAGLLSQDWQTAASRASARVSLVAPLAQGLAIAYGPLASLRQVEGSAFAEGGQLWAADAPGRDGFLAGAGAELVLVHDTALGFPLALSFGYAVPLWRQDGPCAPWPGRFYLGTTVATFPLVPARNEPAAPGGAAGSGVGGSR